MTATHISDTNFWNGFEKRASHAAELGGLGILAIPSLMSLKGKPMKEETAHKMELAGLLTLALPSLKAIGMKAFGK